MNTEGALKKLSADQTSTWYWLLRAMDVAETPALVGARPGQRRRVAARPRPGPGDRSGRLRRAGLS